MLQALKIKNIAVSVAACALFTVISAPVFVSAALHAPDASLKFAQLQFWDDTSAHDAAALLAGTQGAESLGAQTPAVEGISALPTNLTSLVAQFATSEDAELAEEEHCLAQAVYFEARSESLDGQLAVAQVVLNRVGDRRYPSNICGVVFQGEHRPHRCQFSFACDGLTDTPRNAQAWSIAKAISHIALHNHWDDVTSLSTHYHADYVSPYWGNVLDEQVQVGRHIFYRDNSF